MAVKIKDPSEKELKYSDLVPYIIRITRYGMTHIIFGIRTDSYASARQVGLSILSPHAFSDPSGWNLEIIRELDNESPSQKITRDEEIYAESNVKGMHILPNEDWHDILGSVIIQMNRYEVDECFFDEKYDDIGSHIPNYRENEGKGEWYTIQVKKGRLIKGDPS